MKVHIDQSGWELAAEDESASADPSGAPAQPKQPGSGVFAKVKQPSDADLATMPTEPAPSSEEAITASSARLSPPSAVPADLAHAAGEDVA